MFLFRKLLTQLRAGFSSTWSFLLACTLLALLDIGALIGLVWHFFFRERLPAAPETLAQWAVGYLVCVALLWVLATGFGRLKSVRATTLFYGSVGLFFFLRGLLGSAGREFATWPWVVVWLVSLGAVVAQFAREFTFEHDETPHE